MKEEKLKEFEEYIKTPRPFKVECSYVKLDEFIEELKSMVEDEPSSMGCAAIFQVNLDFGYRLIRLDLGYGEVNGDLDEQGFSQSH